MKQLELPKVRPRTTIFARHPVGESRYPHVAIVVSGARDGDGGGWISGHSFARRTLSKMFSCRRFGTEWYDVDRSRSTTDH